MADSTARRGGDLAPALDIFDPAETRRYAHTLRRDVQDIDEPVSPAHAPPPDIREDVSTIAMPPLEPEPVTRIERPAAPPAPTGQPSATLEPRHATRRPPAPRRAPARVLPIALTVVLALITIWLIRML
jgi:hypothetical protein